MKTNIVLLLTIISFAYNSWALSSDDFKGTYANYFSFHGEDSLGKVYFAIDINREHTKKGIKGNNFLYFNINDEWKALKGHENFKIETTELEKIPSSEHFHFNYNSNTISSITSPSNGIKVEFLTPLNKMGAYSKEGILFELYSTKANLHYQDRVMTGNIISERLVDSVGLMSFSNGIKAIFSGFKFDGYYLNVKDLGDLYIHTIDTKTSINFFNDNILTLANANSFINFELSNANYKITKSKRHGLRKLPLEIEVDLPDLKLKLHTTHFKTYRNAFIMAFGMGVIEGELIYNNKSYLVYGLSEVFEL